MTFLKKALPIIILFMFILTGCQNNYESSADIGAEYPVEMFPIYKDGLVYKYEFKNGTIDLTFGTSEDYEKVGKYYQMLFEHSKYDVTAEKMTNQEYISSGKTNNYKYLLEVKKPVFRKEKNLYNTIVNLRININDFVATNSGSTPTPTPVEKITPPPTEAPVATDTPEPTETPYVYLDKEVISTADILDEQIFIECIDIEEETKDNGQKTVSVQLKMINYGQSETGYITMADFVLIDDLGTSYHSDMTDSIFSSGVNIMPGGYCVDYIRFTVAENVIPGVLAMPEGLGSRLNNSYDIELYPLTPPTDAGIHDKDIADIADISDVPTFIIGQEYTIDEILKVKLNNAEYFINHTSSNPEKLMYTFNMGFENISANVIIPTELREFVMYDISHNIFIKPTVDLTPYNELAFNPVQNGLIENYHISFMVTEEISENYLCLMLLDKNQQNNPIIYKIR